MTATIREALRSLDTGAKAVRLNVIVNHLREQDCGKSTAEIKPLQKVTVGASSVLEAVLHRFSVPSSTPVLAVVNNNLEASLEAFRGGEQPCVSALDAVTQLCELLSGSLSVEEASEILLGFHIEACSVTSTLGLNILNMTVAITVVTQSLPLFADGTGGGERGVLGDVTNLNRPLAARLSCGSTNDFLLPGPAATAITNIDNKANMHKGRASLATASKPSSRPAATSCPVVACSLLRPAADGTYGNVSWSAMDQGGAILYNQQQDITKTGSMTYQRLLSDGMGVARLKDSPVETEKVSQNSLQHNTGNGSKVKENKVLPSDRGLAEADIEDADLYAASWTTATGYAVSNMLSADSNFPGKLLARWSKQQDALNADGQPRSSVGGPKCCVPPILTPNDAAQHFRK